MIIAFFRTFFVYSNCIYIYKKSIQNLNKLFNSSVFMLLCPALLASISIILNIYSPLAGFIMPFIFLNIILIFSSDASKITFTLCLISYIFSYSIFAFSGLVITIFLFSFSKQIVSTTVHYSVIPIGILQTLIIRQLFHFKRLKKGMTFIYSSSFINTGMFLSIFLFVLFIIFNYMPFVSISNKLVLIICILATFPILLHWWQSQLTKAYRKRLAQMELESLRTELEQKSILLKKLETQNEEMGRLIHKDNKLIPAMEHAVSTYLTSDFTDLALQQAQGEALLIDLKELSAARQGILSTFTPAATPKYETGIPSLDAILVYMYQKAQSNGIRFYATATQESLAKCPTKLTNEKLVHILSDLLENAIIATKSSSDKQIQLQIYLANGIFTIEIADTGLSFEPATLISFGLEKASTHLKDGGSGIGLLDIWKIKEEVKASIHIHEYETGTPFSKKIFISFDNRNKYVIHTWRDKELAPLVNRGDLVLLSQNQQTA